MAPIIYPLGINLMEGLILNMEGMITKSGLSDENIIFMYWFCVPSFVVTTF